MPKPEKGTGANSSTTQKTGKVYMITSPKGRRYVGSTTRVLSKRWSEYFRLSCKEQDKLYKSLKFHGPKNHKFEVLWEGSFEDTLKMERYYGDFYEVMDRNKGLNLKLPGYDDVPGITSERTKTNISKAKIKKYESNPNHKTKHSIVVDQYSLTGKYINTLLSLSYAKRSLGIPNQAIRKVLKEGSYVYKGFIWKDSTGNISNINIDKFPIKIDQYDINKVLLYTHNNIDEAITHLGVSYSKGYRFIMNCLRRLNKTAFGHVWEFNSKEFNVKDKDIPKRNNKKPFSKEHRAKIGISLRKPVLVYDKHLNLINEFISVTCAANYFNCTPSEIGSSCTNKITSFRGCVAKYKKDTDFDIRDHGGILSVYRKSVNMYDKNGKYLRCYSSVTEASKDINGCASEITASCKNKHSTVKGYRFRLREDNLNSDIEPILPFISFKRKLIDMYDKDWNYVRTFSTISEIHNNNICKEYWVYKSYNSKGEIITPEGFRFKHKPEERAEKISKQTSKQLKQLKPVYQLDKITEEIIKEWSSVTKASATLGIENSNIFAAIKGIVKKNAGGFKWCYVINN